MKIIQAGKTVSRVMPRYIINFHLWNYLIFFLIKIFFFRITNEDLCPLLEVIEVVRPHLNLTFENILSHINTIYVLKTKQEAMANREPSLRLKVYKFLFNKNIQLSQKLLFQGQMMYIAESDVILFQCYPSVMNLDDLTK